ncbi:aminoacyl-tRNA hydrolase [Helicobacter enhydrae]|uniref:Peptidyl-tRNA hydrolase n=1 Tax=Helicobacter enhydrae TaxID=222136 RepID=A0A1B1U7A7_9HELI|nr:aminoacyl-tRNA hydrolase [Helicobacter enhydrae]ANV98626.1 aminoacyl-tRNA hydrolase [Helicobacter enhydrae]
MQKLLIVGLGNPGSQYANNRHNIGFLAIDRLAQELNLTFEAHKKLHAHLAITPNYILCKPQTFMNTSGEAVLAVQRFYKTQELFVIYDDLDLPYGNLRFKKGGGNGGHNGLRSIDLMCGNDYYRARCGIGRPIDNQAIIPYVLGDFEQYPTELITHCVKASMDFVLHQDLMRLQNFFQIKTKPNQ